VLALAAFAVDDTKQRPFGSYRLDTNADQMRKQDPGIHCGHEAT
jgi:hypothetical protein